MNRMIASAMAQARLVAANARMRIARGARFLVLGLAATIAGLPAAHAWPSDLTPRQKETRAIIDPMVEPHGIESMVLAPDGKHAAAIVWTGSMTALVLIDTASGESRVLVAPAKEFQDSVPLEPLQAVWIDSKSLAVDFNDGDCSVVDFDGYRGRTIGDHVIRMIAPEKKGDPAEWALVGERGFFGSKHIRRINVRTGEAVDIPLGLPGELTGVVFDKDGHLRAATTHEVRQETKGPRSSTLVKNWYRHDEKSPWQELAQAPVTDSLWIPIGIPVASDTLVILSREGRDTWAMFSYDTAARKTTDLLVGHPTDDLMDVDDNKGSGLIRVMTNGLKPSTYWFDTRWNQLQRSVDAALPGATNELEGDPQGNVLVFSHSDRNPGTYLLFDTQQLKLKTLGRISSAVDVAAMRPMQTLTYTAEDGLKIPAYLTLPAGPVQPRPLVVYVHGGPVARDEWDWDRQTQMLAVAGYAVLQPQFRGSTGFGHKFEQAGYRQWGLAMQDDVTAGVKAMIARGVADPQRICIFGGSYGGYAALWGLVKTPTLYRCGISFAGVSDIGEMFTDWSDTNDDEVGKEFTRFAVGDVDTMAAQFDAISPEKHADQIQVPVLLAHGMSDHRVPPGHSRRMEAALEKAHKSVESHWYPGEGHGLSTVHDLKDFNAALLDFLDRNIGPTSPLASRWAPAASAASAATP
jgi:dienelactone hydrolase